MQDCGLQMFLRDSASVFVDLNKVRAVLIIEIKGRRTVDDSIEQPSQDKWIEFENNGQIDGCNGMVLCWMGRVDK